MRVKWAFDSTKEMKSNGQLDIKIKQSKLKNEIMSNEERLKNVLLAKLTHSGILQNGAYAGSVSDEVSALFDDSNMIKSQNGDYTGLHKVDASSAEKLENAYQNFIDNLEARGPDHIEMLELWDSGMQF